MRIIVMLLFVCLESRAGSPVEFSESEAARYLFTLGEVAQVHILLTSATWPPVHYAGYKIVSHK